MPRSATITNAPTGHAPSRRELSKSQLAIIAVKMLEPLKAEAHKRQVACLRKGSESPVPPEQVERETSHGEAVPPSRQARRRRQDGVVDRPERKGPA